MLRVVFGDKCFFQQEVASPLPGKMGKTEDSKGDHSHRAFFPDEMLYCKFLHDQVLFKQQIS